MEDLSYITINNVNENMDKFDVYYEEHLEKLREIVKVYNETGGKIEGKYYKRHLINISNDSIKEFSCVIDDNKFKTLLKKYPIFIPFTSHRIFLLDVKHHIITSLHNDVKDLIDRGEL